VKFSEASCSFPVDGFIAALKDVLYEWKQHTVLFVVAVEERTDVTYVAELRAGKEIGAAVFFMVNSSPYYGLPARRIAGAYS
jgi:hypothetical protein